MSMVEPPLTRPTPEQMTKWEGWTEREILIAMLTRHNAMAGMLMQMANDMPEMLTVMKNPMIKAAMKMLIKPDKSNE